MTAPVDDDAIRMAQQVAAIITCVVEVLCSYHGDMQTVDKAITLAAVADDLAAKLVEHLGGA